MKNRLTRFFLSGWTPKEKGLLIADALLLGVLAGWLTSPFKKTAGRSTKFTDPDLWDIENRTNGNDKEEKEDE